jgi:two-component system LytT family response regulator
MSRARVLVVDDEPLAREMLRGLVEEDADLEVVGEAGDGRQAMRQIERLDPDIVLLDIEMPEADGLEAVRSLPSGRQPVFIFVTAYQRYAPEAFDVEALDYVLKPVSEKRLGEALGRAKRRLREHALSEVAEKVASLTAGLAGGEPEAATAGGEGFLDRLPITADGRTRFIEARDIVWIESQDYYVRLHTRAGSPLVRASLTTLEERLDPRRFCQVRRGALVNVREVREIRSLFRGAHAVVLTDGTELRISRSRWQEVREQLTPRLRTS